MKTKFEKARDEWIKNYTKTLHADERGKYVASVDCKHGADWGQAYERERAAKLVHAIKREMNWREIKYCTGDGLDNLGEALAAYESEE